MIVFKRRLGDIPLNQVTIIIYFSTIIIVIMTCIVYNWFEVMK